MKYLCFILCLQISIKECAIDITIPELVYVADHLTTQQCRRLYASLNFVSYELPENLSKAMEKVPSDLPCFELLVKWVTGNKPWEGKGKTHTEVEHRLRQLGRKDLADWLGKTAFEQLSTDLNYSVEQVLYFDELNQKVKNKLFSDNDTRYHVEGWSTIDTVLCIVLFGLLIITMTTFCRLLRLTVWRDVITIKEGDDMIDLMSTGSAESEQETDEVNITNENEIKETENSIEELRRYEDIERIDSHMELMPLI